MTGRRSVPVPRTRIGRLARLGSLGAGLAGGMAAEGARSLARGERPRLPGMALTPGNAARLARELATMRGAAMKVGQLLSMEAGDLLAPELAEILGRLRETADTMPPRQLKEVLSAEWGGDFLRRFRSFETTPIAAASIGQVHRAETRDGRVLAIKVQYPGVAQAIDSDIRNLAGLMRWSGAVPKGLDMGPLLEAARVQLHEEADYRREAAALARFGGLLAEDPEFAVPAVAEEFSTRRILAMDFLPGEPVEALAREAAEVRDRVAAALIRLVLRETFELGLMQTDPNFANYRYDPGTGRIVLLDFGAVQEIAPARAAQLRELLRAALADDGGAIRESFAPLGLTDAATPPHHVGTMVEMARMASAPLRQAGAFDFGASDLVARLRAKGMEIGLAGDFATVPPVDVLLLQRKVAGTYLLVARLGARVELSVLMAPYA
ncbi:ABC1 kinase family protein [Histidinibacterium lentulum]|uniref:AarF/ABC1/UbiB kinase family protein n=1 Tax=Histidinibacterium lentulum TaxID=2480588 RepID=A0A3N2R7Z8_9RHOB|nr:AarF/ABC1/UbiB kinase family protein [Histidinibacterium lentulum]ROU03446.1 AarF/ABC1/UbiB kinase family protein [Histidinibacterium lentulum]